MKFLGLFIFFIFLLAYFRKKSTRKQETVEQAFWDRENEANHVRKQDISGLPYITIPLENFSMAICDNQLLKEYEQTLTDLSTKRILNLNGETNTDLKLKYGPANLEALTEYDQNFITLCRTLADYAKCLLDLGYTAEAKTVLEFGVSCGSDHSQNYRMLSELYVAEGNKDALSQLLAHAQELNAPMKSSIITHLEEQIVSL